MDCNKDEAVRAKEIAEKKFSAREYAGAKKFALKAQNLYPDLDGLSQFLTTLNIYISAEKKISGEMDWYGILGVNPFAHHDTVRKQYRKLALSLHPDKNKSLGADGAFKLVLEAWSLLADKSRRLAYNQKRSLKGFQEKTPTHGGSQSAVPASNGYYNVTNNATSYVRTTNSNTRSFPPSVPSPCKKDDTTFWTICNRCKTHYEYLRIYLNQKLLCPNCNEAFLALEKGPPPNVFKSSNWSSCQQHQHSRYHPAGSNSGNPGRSSAVAQNAEHWDPHSRMGSFAACSAAQGASVVQQASEKVKREREGAFSTADWERSHISRRTDNSFHKVDRPLKRRTTDDIHKNGCSSYMENHMAMGQGAADIGGVSESRKLNFETERSYGFSGASIKHHSTRELPTFEIQKMLIDKARTEIHKKLEEWRSVAKDKVAMKEKDNKKQKSMLNGDLRDQKKFNESTVNGKRHGDSNSFSGTSADNGDEDPEAPIIINVPDPDFHNFDLDCTETSFSEDQVWAAYDDDDGMPRYYARIRVVNSLKPFRMRISWLNSRSNSELGPVNWVESGFSKTCGYFRTGRRETTENLNSFSHKVRWMRGTHGVVCIFPGKGDVWALYSNWSPDWNKDTPHEVRHKYDMVEVLDDFNEVLGVLVTPLIKVAGFRTVFHRHMDPKEVRRIPKEEMFRFSHQVPNHLLSGEEAHNSPQGCRELDPAATPSELLQVTTKANEASMVDNIKIHNKETLPTESDI
ncbi:DnaJ domain [Quillaja saponaria]|uniref:DnaJ domain n=1 Tax=Quillaja saponaria TaxID=32244 RepID=A0AAD7LYG9_QUISA|nr:DnaJ domain [Quillaja saponaria]